jgi:hypothetical protein
MHASVPFPLKVTSAQLVPFEQLAFEQHVSSHLPVVHTPERQSLSTLQEAPGVFRPIVRETELAGTQ